MSLLIPRETWSPAYPAGPAVALPAEQAWAHHTASLDPVQYTAMDTPAEERAELRELEATAHRRFGTTISYSALIFPSGRVYEGCGIGRRGSHTKGRNSIALGIAFVGEMSRSSPTEASVDAAAELLAYLHLGRALLRPAFHGGHRDVAATACPGNNIYAVLGHINAAAAAIVGGTTTEGRRMLIRIAGGKAVFEIVGNYRTPVAAAVFKARGLDHRRDVVDVPADHTLAQLPVATLR